MIASAEQMKNQETACRNESQTIANTGAEEPGDSMWTQTFSKKTA